MLDVAHSPQGLRAQVAEQRSDRGQTHGDTEPHRAELRAEVITDLVPHAVGSQIQALDPWVIGEEERQMEEGESHRGPHEAHRRHRDQHVRLTKFLYLQLLCLAGGDRLPRQLHGVQRRQNEDECPEDQGGLRRDGAEKSGRDRRQEPHHTGRDAESGVRLDEVLVAAQQRRQHGRLRHAVGLVQHHGQERQGKQQQRIQLRHHQQHHDGAQSGDQDDQQASSAGHAVDHRTDESSEHQEWRETDGQEQQNPTSGLTRGDGQEERVGQSDRHGRLAGGHERVNANQAGER